jgi:flavin reductase (DIM6/NTAB) family NADH-FMN oxidoreductase RutF
VMFSATSNHRFDGLKDAVADAQTTGEFVVNLVTSNLKEQMNASSVPAPHEVDEFVYSGLTKADSTMVRCPRVAESPIHLECRYMYSLDILSDDPNGSNTVVFGEVIGVHVDDGVLVNGKIDFLKTRPIGRLGYHDFVEVNNVFSMPRPDWEAG